MELKFNNERKIRKTKIFNGFGVYVKDLIGSNKEFSTAIQKHQKFMTEQSDKVKFVIRKLNHGPLPSREQYPHYHAY